MTDPPKSAIDIVMERLRRKDAEAGTAQQSLTDAQRTAIAEVRTSTRRSRPSAASCTSRLSRRCSIRPSWTSARRRCAAISIGYERERDEKIKRIRDGK